MIIGQLTGVIVIVGIRGLHLVTVIVVTNWAYCSFSDSCDKGSLLYLMWYWLSGVGYCSYCDNGDKDSLLYLLWQWLYGKLTVVRIVNIPMSFKIITKEQTLETDIASTLISSTFFLIPFDLLTTKQLSSLLQLWFTFPRYTNKLQSRFLCSFITPYA